jgi:hypothetical protein
LLRLQGVSKSLMLEIVDVEACLNAQVEEQRIISEVLMTPCPPLRPTFTYAAAHPTVQPFFLVPCPLCCNGYHDFTWIPASCGHCYHPACLFPMIAHSREVPKCLACEEIFSREWLETWGLPLGLSESGELSVGNDLLAMKLRDAYGKYACRLQARRELVETLNKESDLKVSN